MSEICCFLGIWGTGSISGVAGVISSSKTESGGEFVAYRVSRSTGQARGRAYRGERANLKGLVLGCIEAKFCNKICVGKLSPRPTQCTPVHRSQNTTFCSKIAENFANILPNFAQSVNNSLDFGQNLPEFAGFNLSNFTI